VSNIKLYATLGLNTSYFSQAMQPCYDAGKADTGSGVCARIKDLLYRHLTETDPLKQAIDSLAEAYDRNLTLHADALDGDIRRRLTDISEQSNMILHRGAETTEEEQARRQIKVFLDGAMPDINRIEHELAKIRKQYSGWEEEEAAAT
jgi:LPS sulfotransferase NodH